jgi:hypothetical protein
VSEPLYRELERAFTEQTELIDYDAFRAAVYRASKRLGMKSEGTHKTRGFEIQEFASAIYEALRGQGLSSREASANALQEARANS